MVIDVVIDETVRLGSFFTVGFTPMEADGDLVAYRLYIFGIDAESLSHMDVSVTFPSPVLTGQSCYILYRDPGSVDPELWGTVTTSGGSIMLSSVLPGIYSVSLEPPTEDEGWINEGTLNAILAILIVLLGMILVLWILRKD